MKNRNELRQIFTFQKKDSLTDREALARPI